MSVAILAHFDPHGVVAPHVIHHVRELATVTDRVLVVSTADVNEAESAKLESIATLIKRPNEGYDFGSWAYALRPLVEAGIDETVILANDSVIGPLRSYNDVFDEVAQRHGGALPPVLGTVRSDELAPHLQSFFLRFDSAVVASSAFRAFWLAFEANSDRNAVIRRYELGLSRVLSGAGYELAAVFEPTDAERARSAYLSRSRNEQRTQAAQDEFVRVHRDRPPPSNPMIGLWDCALDGRLPWVKFETLRDDPYRVGTQTMIDALRLQWPDRFNDVAEHLSRTRAPLAELRGLKSKAAS